MRQPTKDELTRLKALKNRRAHRDRPWAVAMIHALAGRSVAEISVAVGRSKPTVLKWLEKWENA